MDSRPSKKLFRHQQEIMYLLIQSLKIIEDLGWCYYTFGRSHSAGSCTPLAPINLRTIFVADRQGSKERGLEVPQVYPSGIPVRKGRGMVALLIQDIFTVVMTPSWGL